MPRAAPQRDDRRGRIARALYDCIGEKGYANTTLKDIAASAGMSPSHVGYYFDNKRAILEYYADSICRQNLAELPALGGLDVEARIDGLSDFCLGPGRMNVALLGVIQELTGLAVHDASLHDIKANHTRKWREYLEVFFEETSLASGLTAREAAFRAHAILVGLNTNTLFDDGLGRERAHDLFRMALRELAGLTVAGRGQGARRGALPARKRSPSKARRKSR